MPSTDTARASRRSIPRATKSRAPARAADHRARPRTRASARSLRCPYARRAKAPPTAPRSQVIQTELRLHHSRVARLFSVSPRANSAAFRLETRSQASTLAKDPSRVHWTPHAPFSDRLSQPGASTAQNPSNEKSRIDASDRRSELSRTHTAPPTPYPVATTLRRRGSQDHSRRTP